MRLPPSPSIAAALLAMAVAWPDVAFASGVSAAGSRPVTSGRYLVSGTARANVTVLPAREYPVDVLVLVAPGDGPGGVRLHLRARGYACELRGRVESKQVLALEPGQSCQLDLQGPDQRGRIDARLQTGKGRLSQRELSLQLAWELGGSVSVSSGSRVTIPGTSVELTLPESPAVPVRGTVEAEVSGPRDDAARAAR
jgi:hypothetical protein